MEIVIALVLGALGLASIRMALMLTRLDRLEYEKSRARYPSFFAALAGRARVKHNGAPDGRVRAGMVYNKKHNRIEPNGRLRNEVVDQVR